MSKLSMTIDELAVASGVTSRTIRFYTQEGILPPPTDYDGRVALYSPEHLNKLSTIKELKEHYAPLALIKNVINDPEKLAHIQVRLTASPNVFDLLGHKPRKLSAEELAKKGNLSVMAIEKLEDADFLCLGMTETGPKYSENDLEIVRRIARLKELGFTVDDLTFIPKMLKGLIEAFVEVGHDKVKQIKKKDNKQAFAELEQLLTAQRELIGMLFQQLLRQKLEENQSRPRNEDNQ